MAIGFIELILALLVAVLLPVVLVVLVIKAIVGNASRETGSNSAEETRLIQEIHHGLSGLEKRVESLETLLLDRVRKEEPLSK